MVVALEKTSQSVLDGGTIGAVKFCGVDYEF